MKKINFSPLQTKLEHFFFSSGSPQNSKKVLLVRSAESQGNLSGTVTGWMDVRLSDYGRKQAFAIN